MRACPCEACDNLVARSYRFLDSPVNVRERGPHHRDDLFQTFSPLSLSGQGIEFDEVLFYKLVGCIEASLVNDFLYEALEGGDVFRFRHAQVLQMAG